MDALASECSSGCESGWTVYLDQSFVSPNPAQNSGAAAAAAAAAFGAAKTGGDLEDGDDEQTQHLQQEEEDLSMVSDASSGPPHFCEDDQDCSNDDNACFCPAFLATASAPALSKGSKSVQKPRRHHRQESHSGKPYSPLDDTASSPAFSLSRNKAKGASRSNLDSSHGYSAADYQAATALQGHLNFLQQSEPGNQFQHNQWFGGRRWG